MLKFRNLRYSVSLSFSYVLHECPLFPPLGCAGFHAPAAFSVLRARAARNLNSQNGLKAALRWRSTQICTLWTDCDTVSTIQKSRLGRRNLGNWDRRLQCGLSRGVIAKNTTLLLPQFLWPHQKLPKSGIGLHLP